MFSYEDSRDIKKHCKIISVENIFFYLLFFKKEKKLWDIFSKQKEKKIILFYFTLNFLFF